MCCLDRVNLEEVTGGDSYEKTANGFSRPTKKVRKRHRQNLEVEDSSSEEEECQKRKKRKWTIEHLSNQEKNNTNIQELKKKEKVVTERNCVAGSSLGGNPHSKKLKKRADQEKEQEAERAKKKPKARTLDTKTKKSFPLGPSQKCSAKNTKPQSNTKIGETPNESSTSSSDSDHSTTAIKQKLPVAALHTHKSQVESPAKSVPVSKLATEPKNKSSCKTPNLNKSENSSSSSDSDSSSEKEEEQQSSNLKKKLPHNKQGTVTSGSSKSKPKTSSSESDSSESDTCTVKKPKTSTAQSLVGNGSKLPNDTSGPSHSNPARGRGRGENVFWRGPRVRGCRGMVRGRGRGRGEGSNFFYNYNGDHQKHQQLNEVATNTSVIIQVSKNKLQR